MSYTEKFVIQNNLQPADAILLRKKFMGMLDHFAVYIGRDIYNNRPLFAANYLEGVKILRKEEVNNFLSTLVPEKIERFKGSPLQRKQAVERAIKMMGKATYNLITNNCEHYKNFVQFNKKYSAQVDFGGRVAAITGGVAIVAGLALKKPKVVGLGLFALALGAIAISAAKQEE